MGPAQVVFRAEGVGPLVGADGVLEAHLVAFAVVFAFVAHRRTQQAAAVKVALHRAVLEVDDAVFVVGFKQFLGGLEGVARPFGMAEGGHLRRRPVAGIHTCVVARIVAVAAAEDVVVAAAQDGHVGLIHSARVVVAAEHTLCRLGLGVAAAVHGHRRRSHHVRTPAAAVDGLERLAPRRIGCDIGVIHIAALAAAVGLGRGQRLRVVQVHVRAALLDAVRSVHVAQVRLVQVLPVALAAAIHRAVDGQRMGFGCRAGMAVHHHVGRTAVAHRATAEDIGVERAAPQVHRRRIHERRAVVPLHHHAVLGGVGLLEVVDVVFATHQFVVVFSVRPAVDLVHRAVAHVDARVALHRAAHVVAAEQVVDDTVADVDIGHTVHIGHAASAEQRILDLGRVVVYLNICSDAIHRVAAEVAVFVTSAHRTAVAAAEHILHLALFQHDVGHAGHHVVAVVAAEDGPHCAEAVARSVQQHHHVLTHTHAVAAAEHRVDAPASRVQARGRYVDIGRGLQRTVDTAAVVAHRHRRVVGTRAVVVVGSVTAAIHAVDPRRAVDPQVRVVGGVPL